MTTRAERLTQQVERRMRTMARERQRLAHVKARQRALARKAVQQRCLAVGKLVQAHGLFTLPGSDLIQLLELLGQLVQECPDPVAVLEGLLHPGGSGAS